jgi:hypothetical protein
MFCWSLHCRLLLVLGGIAVVVVHFTWLCVDIYVRWLSFAVVVSVTLCS